jgi:hypothetical protein
MTQYPRPAEHIVPSPKVPVDIVCPNCGANAVYEYPVTSEGGWFRTKRCQDCLFQLERTRWRLHGPTEFLADQIGGM